jgi:hypothetical protein
MTLAQLLESLKITLSQHEKANHTQLNNHETPSGSSFSASYFTNTTPPGKSSSRLTLIFEKISKISRRIYKSPIFVPMLITVAIVAVIAYFINSSLISPNSSSLESNTNAGDISKPSSSQTLNRQFSFPLKDGDGVEISRFKYEIQNIEKRKEIIIKGQKATAVQDRTFLIVNLKITNDYNKSIQINAKDFVRLIIGKSKEKLAPDIHNDPVEIQAISTKYTRIGFPVNETDSDLSLQIGEITGDKKIVKLN